MKRQLNLYTMSKKSVFCCICGLNLVPHFWLSVRFSIENYVFGDVKTSRKLHNLRIAKQFPLLKKLLYFAGKELSCQWHPPSSPHTVILECFNIKE